MRLKMDWCRYALPVGIGLIRFVAAGRKAQPLPHQQSAPQMEVKIDNFTYCPVTVTVAAGTTVKWVNRDDIPHRRQQGQDHVQVQGSGHGRFVFLHVYKPGTYTYFCSIHPKMMAKIVVQ